MSGTSNYRDEEKSRGEMLIGIFEGRRYDLASAHDRKLMAATVDRLLANHAALVVDDIRARMSVVEVKGRAVLHVFDECAASTLDAVS